MKRDYSLHGESTKLAIEEGLASAEWYHTEIPRATMKELMQRSDGPAIRDTLLWLFLLAASAGATVVGMVTGSRPGPDSKLFVGSGKAEEIKAFLLGDETLNGYLGSLWQELKGWLKQDLQSEDSALRRRLSPTGAAVGELNGMIIGLDLLPMEAVAGVDFVLGDFTEDRILAEFETRLEGARVELAGTLGAIFLADEVAQVRAQGPVTQRLAVHQVEVLLVVDVL